MEGRDQPMSEMSRISEDEILYLIESARPEQQQAIRSQEPLVVVSAGAGTGKTHTLAMRFAWLLAVDPGCTVEQILTLTFSEAASREMLERIRATLQKWYRQEPKKLAHLKDAIMRIDEAYISTIHSFSMRVIRESGLSLDLDPAAGLASAPFESSFWDDYTQTLDTIALDRLSGLLDGEWLLRAREWMESDLFTEGLNYYTPEGLSELAKKAGELFGSKGWTPETLWSWGDAQNSETRDRIVALLSPHWQEAWELWQQAVLPAIADPLRADKGSTSETLRQFAAEYSDVPNTLESQRDFFAALVTQGLSKIPGGKALKSALEDALGTGVTGWRNERKALALLTATLCRDPLMDERESSARRFLLNAAAIGWQAWERTRKARSILSFSDLIRYAGDALRTRNDRMGFRHLMVDEFQDTDALQNRLLEALWDRKENSLFIVGDLKQSIYRFRHADLRLFASYIRRADAGGEGVHIPLNCSYRMNDALIEGGNSIFDHLWRGGICGDTSMPYEPLVAPTDSPLWKERNEPEHCELRGDTIEAIIAVTADGVEKAPTADKKREVLYRALAERFCALMEEKAPVWEKGPNPGFRPVRWSDFGVLVPSRTSYAPLEEAFEALKIPAVFAGNQSYFSRGEVLDLVNFLRMLEDPRQELSLAGWIASPFSGLPPHGAVELLSESKAAKMPLWELFDRKYPEAMLHIDILRRRALLESPSSALSALLESPSWLRTFRGDARRRAFANIRRGVEIAREYEAAMGNSLSGCADYLAAELARSNTQQDPDIFDANADVVRVMTIHASKGLEFPIVAVVGLEKKISRNNTSRTDPSLHCGVTLSSIPESFSPFEGGEDPPVVSKLWHAYLEKDEEIQEQQRLFYVAVTRAQDRLILCGLAKSASEEDERNAKNTLLNWFLDANRQRNHPFPVTLLEVGEEGVGKGTERTERSGTMPQILALPKQEPASLARLSASAYSLLRWCPRAYRLRYRQGRELVWELPDGDGYGGADLGNLAHYVLERWDFDASSLDQWLPDASAKEDVESLIRTVPLFLRAEYKSSRSRKILKEWLALFAASSESAVLRSQLAAGTLNREVPFRVKADRVTLVGSMDLCWQEKGIHIRDWKITAENSAPHELYERQLLFYGAVCHLAAPGNVADLGLIYLRPGSFEGGVDWLNPAGETDWEEVKGDILSAAQEATGDLEPNLSRCSRCPWRKTCNPPK